MLYRIYSFFEDFFERHKNIGFFCWLFLLILTAMGFLKFIEDALEPRVDYETMTFSYSESGENFLIMIFTILAGIMYAKIYDVIQKWADKCFDEEIRRVTDNKFTRISNQSQPPFEP